MLVGGVQGIKKPVSEPLVFSRGFDSEGKEIFLVFRAVPVDNYEEFFSLCPKPTPTGRLTLQGWQNDDTESEEYIELAKEWSRRRSQYTFLKSLEPSELTWEKVIPNKPETWGFIDEELKAFLSHYEFVQLANLVNEANALNQDRLDEAKERFFRSRGTPAK